MKRITSVLVCILALTFLVMPSGNATADEAVKKELLKNINGLWEAWKTYNPEPFKQWMFQEGLTVSTSGSTNLPDFLKQMASKQCQVKSFTVDEASARLTKIDNNTYVITYRAEQDAICSGAKSPSPITVSEVWSKQGGKWKAYHYQETPLVSN